MKIAEYIGGFGTGGIEHVVTQLFWNMNHEKNLIDFLIDFKQEVDCAEDIYKNNGRIVSIFNQEGLITKKRQKIFKIIYLYKLLKKEKYDVIHFHLSYPNPLIYCFVAMLAGVKVRVVQSHANAYGDIGKIHYIIGEICRRLFLPTATRCLAVSKEAGEWLFGKRQFEIITNGIEIEKFKYSAEKRKILREQYAIPEYIKVIGHVGRLSYAKNHVFLLKIFAEILKNEANSVLMLVGEGDLEIELHSEAQKMGIQNNILWMPFTSQVEDYYQMMDVFVFPSRYEGFGIAALEAQVSGLPVWVSNKVPNEVKISEAVYTLSLDKTANEWAIDILEKIKGYQRVDQTELTRKAGFGIKDKSKWLEQYYQKIYDSKKK